MNINTDPISGAPQPVPTQPFGTIRVPEESPETRDTVDLSQAGLSRAENPAPSEEINDSEGAIEAALNAAQQIKQDSPDSLYDWSGMTPERLKELLG